MVRTLKLKVRLPYGTRHKSSWYFPTRHSTCAPNRRRGSKFRLVQEGTGRHCSSTWIKIIREPSARRYCVLDSEFERLSTLQLREFPFLLRILSQILRSSLVLVENFLSAGATSSRDGFANIILQLVGTSWIQTKTVYLSRVLSSTSTRHASYTNVTGSGHASRNVCISCYTTVELRASFKFLVSLWLSSCPDFPPFHATFVQLWVSILWDIHKARDMPFRACP